MQFETAEAKHLAGLKPVDGVFKLESALEQINVALRKVSDSSVEFQELQSLHQTYTKYHDEAKALRQKGNAAFRKYLAAKRGEQRSDVSTASPRSPTNVSTNTAMVNASHQSVQPTSSGSTAASNATQININITNPQSGATSTTQMSSMNTVTTLSPLPPRSPPNPQQRVSNDTPKSSTNSAEMQQLTKQNEDLKRKLSEYEETEHELRLILEEYKFSQLSHKQEIASLKNTMAAYKKASSQKSKSLDTLSNEYESTKNRNATMSKQNTELKQQLAEYLTANTNLKQQLIEKSAECDALQRENIELKSKLKLSQQLNPDLHPTEHPVVDMDSIDAPVLPVVEPKSSPSPSSRKHSNQVSFDVDDIAQKLRRVHDELAVDEHHELCREVESILERLHPINTVTAIPTQSDSGPRSQPQVNDAGNYVLTASEYNDIEQVVEDRDRYFNESRFLQQELHSMKEQYEEWKVRCSQLEEEKSLMMSTLKKSVEALAIENTELKEKVGSVDERVSSIKEHDQSTLNRFHKIYEENKERKFEMKAMEERIEGLLRDVATFRYLSENLQTNNGKLREDLTDALERIDKVVEDKEIIARKLRESNKLTHQMLRERQSSRSSVSGINETGSTDLKLQEESTTPDQEVESIEAKYERVLMEKMEVEKLFDESDGTVNELTNQIIELETRLRELELENEMLRKEVEQITTQNTKQSNQIKSAQRVALSIMQSNKENGGNGLANYMASSGGQQTDMFGLQPPPEPDLITSLLTYLLPFLFEEDDQPKIV